MSEVGAQSSPIPSKKWGQRAQTKQISGERWNKLCYEGIDFPTPIKQINKLEKQNRNLAISIFGWEDGHVVIHRISERREENDVKLINLMLIEKAMNQHY